MNRTNESRTGDSPLWFVLGCVLMALVLVVIWRVYQGYSLSDLTHTPSLLWDGVISYKGGS